MLFYLELAISLTDLARYLLAFKSQKYRQGVLKLLSFKDKDIETEE